MPTSVWIAIASLAGGAILLRRPLLAWLRDAEDPTVAAVVWAIGLAGVLIGLSAAELHDRAVADYGLKALGGVLVLLTAYFTARSLRQAARTGFLERLMRASELLAERDAVKQRAGQETLYRLLDYAQDTADKKAVETVLAEFAHNTDVHTP
jgi:hypothetical protein